MEKVKQILYQVTGNGEFTSKTFHNIAEAENVAFITKGKVVKIIKP
ncbi:hypothetical protein GF374_01985 [Candidatus Woesearchaeota archaeon]|nr:hypothetical protein [Candidatus Woesearchaeota archaeon]